MKLTGDLKKKVENAESRDEVRKTIEDAGMLLTDDELEQVTGGRDGGVKKEEGKHYCAYCKKEHDRITKYSPWVFKYNRFKYTGSKYVCTLRGVFYEVSCPDGPQYFDANLNLLF